MFVHWDRPQHYFLRKMNLLVVAHFVAECCAPIPSPPIRVDQTQIARQRFVFMTNIIVLLYLVHFGSKHLHITSHTLGKFSEYQSTHIESQGLSTSREPPRNHGSCSYHTASCYCHMMQVPEQFFCSPNSAYAQGSFLPSFVVPLNYGIAYPS